MTPPAPTAPAADPGTAMTAPANQPRRPIVRRPTRRGFSFVEVLFAVIILGVGFILVAAVFPVGIQMTRTTVEETAGGRIAGTAIANFNALAYNLTDATEKATLTGVAPNQVPQYSTWYYGWPLTYTGTPNPPVEPAAPSPQTAAFPGVVMSFRDSRTTSFYTPAAIPLVAPLPPLFKLDDTGTGTPGLWNRIRGDLILPNEPQYAYVPLFQRGWINNPAAATTLNPTRPDAVVADHRVNLYVFAVTARNRVPYTYNDLAASGGNASLPFGDVLRHPYSAPDTSSAATSLPATLEPKLITTTFYRRALGDGVNDTVVITHDPAMFYTAADQGGFLIVSNDDFGPPVAPNTKPNAGVYNGRSFRLGSLVSTGSVDTWALQPGDDIPNTEQGTTAGSVPFPANTMQAFIVGKQLRNPGQAFDPSTNPYEGSVQDIGVFSFTITAP